MFPSCKMPFVSAVPMLRIAVRIFEKVTALDTSYLPE